VLDSGPGGQGRGRRGCLSDRTVRCSGRPGPLSGPCCVMFRSNRWTVTSLSGERATWSGVSGDAAATIFTHSSGFVPTGRSQPPRDAQSRRADSGRPDLAAASGRRDPVYVGQLLGAQRRQMNGGQVVPQLALCLCAGYDHGDGRVGQHELERQLG
jgi:hypothetical protein